MAKVVDSAVKAKAVATTIEVIVGPTAATTHLTAVVVAVLEAGALEIAKVWT